MSSSLNIGVLGRLFRQPFLISCRRKDKLMLNVSSYFQYELTLFSYRKIFMDRLNSADGALAAESTTCSLI